MAGNITIPIKTKDKRDRIEKYLEVLYKFHKLTDKEIQLLVELIIIYTDLRDNHGEEIATTLLFHVDNKNKIRKNLNNMNSSVFHNYLSYLRKKAVIKGKSINPVFIPPVEDFKLIISFSNG